MVSKEELVDDVFKKYIDPEIGIDIWTLGLVYNVTFFQNKAFETKVKVLLTFTSPYCPYGPQMVNDLKEQIQQKGVKEVEIEVTFDPPWKPSEELKEMLGMGV